MGFWNKIRTTATLKRRKKIWGTLFFSATFPLSFISSSLILLLSLHSLLLPLSRLLFGQDGLEIRLKNFFILSVYNDGYLCSSWKADEAERELIKVAVYSEALGADFRLALSSLVLSKWEEQISGI